MIDGIHHNQDNNINNNNFNHFDVENDPFFKTIQSMVILMMIGCKRKHRQKKTIEVANHWAKMLIL